MLRFEVKTKNHKCNFAGMNISTTGKMASRMDGNVCKK